MKSNSRRPFTIDELKADAPGSVAIGPFGSRMKSDTYTASGVPVIRGTNISATKAFEGEFVFVSNKDADALGNCNVYDGDLVFPHRGNIGQVGIVLGRDARYIISSSLMKLTVNRKLVDPLFLFYWFRSSEGRHALLANASQVGTPGIATPLASLRSIKLTIPSSTDEQQQIAHVLGTLDDKIELNRRMNATLEAIAQALFQSWFVDFDPVRAKAAGRQPTGVDNTAAVLFPSEFETSSLGDMPKGWAQSDVGSEFTLTMGQSPPGSTYNEAGDGLPFYQGRTDFGFRFPSRRVYCTAPTRFAEPGDTLVSVRAPVGDVNLASERCAIGRGVAAVRHHSGNRSFTYYAMQNLHERFAHYEAEGTVFGSISKSDFEQLPFLAPPADVIAKFEAIAGPLDDAIGNNERESHALAAIRDVLLPKLLSGELTLTDLENASG